MQSKKSRGKSTENVWQIINQNVNGIVRSWKLETVIKNMMNNNIDAYTIQETWLTEDWEIEIREYLMIYNNNEKDKKKHGREK